tara:strand:- start:18 stop:1208 length:1191 start_codon:yes stop_codon:yes gene_type:complete
MIYKPDTAEFYSFPKWPTLLTKAGLFALLLYVAFFTAPILQEAIQAALADAYIAVSAFVGMTVAVFYIFERRFKSNLEAFLETQKQWHIPVAAMLGVLPGCGGAIVVITQFTLGRTGFGAVVAALCATMGDAAFLLLAKAPETALAIFAVAYISGTVTGFIVERIHGRDFLQRIRQEGMTLIDEARCRMARYPVLIQLLWFGLLIPGIILAFGNAFQIETDQWFGIYASYEPTKLIGIGGALLCFVIWCFMPGTGSGLVNLAAQPGAEHTVSVWQRIILDTSFITAFVILAFTAYELLMHFTGWDLASAFDAIAILLPLIATLIGFIPGCGPQIIVATLHINGLVPFSALLANVLSNDGDALFPAIAIAPRTALLATLYTAVPALIIGYGFYFIGV